MCPAEAFYLARKAQNFIHSACLLEKHPLGSNVSILALGHADLARLRSELCTPALKQRKMFVVGRVHLLWVFNDVTIVKVRSIPPRDVI